MDSNRRTTPCEKVLVALLFFFFSFAFLHTELCGFRGVLVFSCVVVVVVVAVCVYMYTCVCGFH